MVEARTQSNLHTVCTTVMPVTIAPKIADLTGLNEENGSGFHVSLATIRTQRSQPHHAIEPPSSAILTILSFAFSIVGLSNQSSSTSPADDISSSNPTNNLPNTKQQFPSQNQSQSTTPTSTTNPGTPATKRGFPHSRHNPCNHWRLQY
jgi:hypothetical protein